MSTASRHRDAAEPTPPGPGRTATRDVTLLLVDLVDSTTLVQSLGDQRASIVLGRFATTLRATMDRCGGLEIDHSDGFLILFDDPRSAVLMALQLHRDLQQLALDNHTRLSARVGIHHGPAVLTHNPTEAIARGAKRLEIEGLTKPLCARICDLASGGQTLLSGTAFERVQRAPSLPEADRLRWVEHGLYLLKGIDDPQPVYEVGYAGEAPLAAPDDADKARLLRDDDLVTGWRAGVEQDVPGRAGWRLLRKLGAGGYGDTWLAHAEADGQQRAFKFCYAHSRLRSLQREVALFGLMQRALGERRDIARIIDWHLEQPPYFIESEFSPLGDLSDWCASQGGAPQVPLDVRLELIAQIADALAAAHAVGVLHKDIKPGNVLIHSTADGQPFARLADFGIGAVSASSRYQYGRGVVDTGMTEMLVEGDGSRSTGTRMYLAPEQIEGQAATTHADAYSLGILLYQSVRGDFSKSLAPGWEQDIDDPLLREDIADLIARDPAQRIGNLNALAQRLRSLDSRHQQRDAALQAAAAQKRRRRLWRLAAPAVAGLLVLVLVLGVLLQRISAEAERANRAADSARAVTSYLVGLFEQADPLHARGEELTVREVMDRGLESAADTLADQPLIRARLMSAIGRVYLALGAYDTALPILEQAWDTLQQAAEADPVERSTLRQALINARDVMGQYDSAQALAQSALAEARDNHGEDSVEAGLAHASMGMVLNSKDAYPSAARHLRAAAGIFSRHLPAYDGEYAEALKMLASNYIKQERDAEAISLLERALDVVENDLDRADVLASLGGSLRQQGKFRAALKRFRQVEAIYRDYELTHHGAFTGVLFNVATAYSLLGEFERARGYFAQSLELYREIYGEQPYWAYALTLKALGGTLENLGRYAQAEPLLREARAQYIAMHGKDNRDVARMLSMIALAQAGQGQFAAALRDARSANAALRALSEAAPDDLGTLHSYAEAVLAGAHAMMLAGRADEAARACSVALAFADGRLDVPTMYNDARRAKLLLCAGRGDEAHAILARLDAMNYRQPWLQQLRENAFSADTGQAP